MKANEQIIKQSANPQLSNLCNKKTRLVKPTCLNWSKLPLLLRSMHRFCWNKHRQTNEKHPDETRLDKAASRFLNPDSWLSILDSRRFIPLISPFLFPFSSLASCFSIPILDSQFWILESRFPIVDFCALEMGKGDRTLCRTVVLLRVIQVRNGDLLHTTKVLHNVCPNLFNGRAWRSRWLWQDERRYSDKRQTYSETQDKGTYGILILPSGFLVPILNSRLSLLDSGIYILVSWFSVLRVFSAGCLSSQSS